MTVDLFAAFVVLVMVGAVATVGYYLLTGLRAFLHSTDDLP